MGIIDFKTSPYFSGALFFGTVLTFIGLLLLAANVLVGLIVLFLCVLLTTTHYRIAIDLKKKVYRDYLWILGFRKGDHRSFETIEYIFIKTNNVRQTMNFETISSTIHKEVFDGYLKFSENNKVHLMTSDSKKNLLSKVEPIAKKLCVEIVDYTLDS